jgi:phage-related protein
MADLWEIEFYVDANGIMPAKEYLAELDKGEKKRFQVALQRLSQLGLMAGYPYSDKIEENLYELRLANSPHNSRFLYCAVIGRRFYLLHGFSKTGQPNDKVPNSEITIAKKRRTILLEQGAKEQKAVAITKKKVKK